MDNKQPKLYVLIGVPGAGKSTWVENQLWAKDCAYISTDRIIERYARWVKKTYTDVFGLYMPRAVNVMVKQVKHAREHNKDIIWDQTSTTVESRGNKFRLLPNYYAIAIVFKTPEKAELERRLANRPGKIIPTNVVEGMVRRWQDPTEEEGFKEIWYT